MERQPRSCCACALIKLIDMRKGYRDDNTRNFVAEYMPRDGVERTIVKDERER